MPSPFPGMNPYLEHPHVWTDFHQTYMPYLREALTPLVGPGYFVDVQANLYLGEVGRDDRSLVGIADAGISAESSAGPGEAGAGPAAVAAPVEVTLPRVRKERSAYLRIVDRDGRRVVTVIELLSPSNKYAGDDRASFLVKRRKVLRSRANYVELDFLRGGPRAPLGGLPDCAYYALVSRPGRRPRADLWPVGLRDPLPVVPVPLGVGDRDIAVDLQAVLHRVYDAAGYARRVYRRPPVPALSAADAAWAAGFIPPG